MFKKRIAILVSVIISAAAVLAGCASDSGTEIEKTVNSSVSVQASTDVITETSVQTSELFTERDLEQTADTDKAVSIAVSDGQTSAAVPKTARSKSMRTATPRSSWCLTA